MIKKFKNSGQRYGRQYRSFARQYSLLLILPLILGIAVFLCVQAVISRQIEDAGSIAAQRFQAQASGVLREVQLVTDSLAGDSRFWQDLNADSVRDFDPMELCALIRDRVRASRYVSDVFVLNQRQGYVYSDATYYIYPQNLRVLSDVLPDYDSIDVTGKKGWHVLNADYTPPHYITSVSGPDGADAATVIVTLSMREFLHTLIEGNTALSCIFNDEFGISTLLVNHPGLDWRSEDAVSEVLGMPVRCFYIEGEDFTYLTAISTRSYYAPLRTVIAVFGVYFVLLLIVGFLYLRRASIRRYKNMVALLDGLPQATAADPTYEEILTAIKTSLLDYRERDRTEEQRQTLRLLLFGSFAGPVSPQQLAAAGLKPGAGGYYAVLFHISEGSGVITDGPPAMNADMTCLILRSALDRFADGHFSVSVTHIDRDYCAVLSADPQAPSRDAVRKAVQDTVGLIEQEYGFDLCAMVSAPVAGAEHLRDAYQQAYSLFGFYRAVDSSVDVLMQEDMQAGTGVLLNGDYMKQLQVLSNTLLLEKYDYIPSMVAALLDEHVAKIRRHYDFAQERIHTVAGILADAVFSSGLPAAVQESAVERLRQSGSITQLNASTREVFGYMSQQAAADETGDIVNAATAYIGEHLTDPLLSVPSVCEAVGASVQHVSRLFRKKMNTTIVEYINSCRIQRSRELLMQKNMTVLKAAEAVGYNNTVTFTRNFRRYVGMAPSEYRELNK